LKEFKGDKITAIAVTPTVKSIGAMGFTVQ